MSDAAADGSAEVSATDATAADADRFAGRRAIVTGASRGIGAAVAEQLAAEGAAVAITARTLDHHPTLPGSLRETAGRIEARGGRVVVVTADLTDEAERARIVPTAVEALGGPVDVLVNNAAAAIYQPLADFPLRRRRLTFEVNVHAPFDLAQAVLPAMVEAGEGWIVNVTSATARPPAGPPFPAHGLAATTGVYAASKAALNRLTHALAAEVSGTGVCVNTVEPRAGVRSEGADALVGEVLADDKVEPLSQIVGAAVALCACGPDVTGRSYVSDDLAGLAP
jgi:NAD(P)-dependent dehydrogenase (short-subunit alcohol dehydrogenase family)